VQRSGGQQRIICEHGTEVFNARSHGDSGICELCGQSVPTSGGAVYNEHMSRKKLLQECGGNSSLCGIAGEETLQGVLEGGGYIAL
jgi:hypothetical protein